MNIKYNINPNYLEFLNAVEMGDLKLVKFLKENSDSEDAKKHNLDFDITQDNNKALSIAVECGHKDIIEYLIKNGCSLDNNQIK
jgi:ankyrin repeat protein